ncbi:T-cell antigen CD7-like [Melanotaenia boesemani]|uniref:T-cell antigen CD7-like n=1 Tax=Melanotaenia boesemani TaxID=1250792 RepID=UPI001C058A32|nr:T-cell antigen CD7-like [Melanotaenia boesemani]
MLSISCGTWHISSPQQTSQEALLVIYNHTDWVFTQYVRKSYRTCSRCANMILFSCSILLCFALVLSESHIKFQSSGESITLKCSTEGSPASTSGYQGLYLYHQCFKDKEEEVLFVGKRTPGTVVERPRYNGRIQSKGAPDNLNITISNLTKYDAGVYRCTYKTLAQNGITSNVYSVFIRESAGAASTECDPAADLQPKLSDDTFNVESSFSTTSENSLQLYLVVVACLITMLVTMIISVLVTLKVKQWRKRSARRTQAVPNEYVYEDMRNHRSHLVADAEQLPVN